MGRANYSFANRQRDLAEEQRKEEKLQRKKATAEEAALNHEGEVAAEDDVDAPKDSAPDA